MNSLKKNWLLILATLAPFSLLLIIGLIVWLPSLLVEPPEYDYVYTVQYPTCVEYEIQLDGNQLDFEERSAQRCTSGKEVELYYHDVSQNRSSLLSKSEGEDLRLDTALISPDGFKIEKSDYNNVLLQKDGLNITQELDISAYQFEFLGWVVD